MCLRPSKATSSRLAASNAEEDDSLVDLDLTGLKCPLPVLKARKALRGYDEGVEVRIRVTDPRAPADFKALCDTVGHAMVSEERDGDGKILTLRVHNS